MGGSQNIGEESDNPVEINVTAMVDVIFCLCIFFMCSFHFKQLEGKMEAWMPTGHGNQISQEKVDPILDEIRVFLRWDAPRGTTTRKVGRTDVSSDAELMDAIRARKGDYERAGKSIFPIKIDATEDVPWSDVVHVLDLCKADKLTSIEFVEPMQYRPANR
jgi:biopolymer transport protein ExbD